MIFLMVANKKMGPQEMFRMALNRDVNLFQRRSMFQDAMIQICGSEHNAIMMLRILMKGQSAMEFFAKDPYGDLVCCSWMTQLLM